MLSIISTSIVVYHKKKALLLKWSAETFVFVKVFSEFYQRSFNNNIVPKRFFGMYGFRPNMSLNAKILKELYDIAD